ncbi:TBC domain-containing protein kinase-like protein [Phlebotomus argentipes]|uniref:TBC domain-containing protein kinase-like protein n=1 Tax=Phlebotomus argentipes TaxID=94469 RepID=UPI00289324CE|nr:TBC domain-containing protein kinase-like protein [Phlebotomus argentipes]
MSPCVSKCVSNLAAYTFFARCHSADTCGTNGLPLTPNSIAIVGLAQFLKSINHPNLCEFIEIIRGKHERTIVVSEYVGEPLAERLPVSSTACLQIFRQIAAGLDHIHNLGFVHHNLEPENILLDAENRVKLFNYGLHYVTNSGSYVSFPIGNVRYMSPERLLGSKNNIKSDVWSLGIIMVEIIFQVTLWSNLKIAQIIRKVLSLCNTDSVLEKIAREQKFFDKYQELDESVRNLLESCLCISVENRLLPEEILNHAVFEDVPMTKERDKPGALLLRCPLKQIYYLWQLAGGDVQAELKKEGLIRTEAPILVMPSVILLNGRICGSPRSQSHLFDNRVVHLSLANLTERLSKISKLAYYPLIHTNTAFLDFYRKGEKKEEYLPLVIREKDTEYQFHRVVLFRRLLKGYPFTRDLIMAEAQKDIPPLLRGQVWACVLGVLDNTGCYEKIDKATPTSTDRQIEVDIPRCHQYDEFLSSPVGHRKLKRLLKAWVTSHTQYVYWQGLDSLTAPFLYLNFNNEERAFHSLYKFIPKYLHWFFLKDNSAVIKEYLSKFSQLTTFHEPVLAKHLVTINFIPELFAIPWFLTMFSHVFPLHKIIHLWDKLMLGDHSYPLFIGISVLKQLKNTLLSSGFNECILLFSDLPDIVMETCVIDSQKLYVSTPKSLAYRKFVLHEKELGQFDVQDVELEDLKREMCPRISANDLVDLHLNSPDRLIVIDLRNSADFRRAHLTNSLNIPFTSVLLGDTRLSALGTPNLEAILANRVVAIVSSVHENAILFSNFLVDCGVSGVCILHRGFNVLHSFCPNVLKTSQ